MRYQTAPYSAHARNLRPAPQLCNGLRAYSAGSSRFLISESSAIAAKMARRSLAGLAGVADAGAAVSSGAGTTADAAFKIDLTPRSRISF